MTKLKRIYEFETLPDKFVAIYEDGSGGNVYYKSGELWYEAGCYEDDFGGVDKEWFPDACYLWFIELPDDFEIFTLKHSPFVTE